MKVRIISLALMFVAMLVGSTESVAQTEQQRPNILFCIADDWGWPHASAYANDSVVETPAFDRIAKEGILFENAFVSAPSCTASRNAILTGQYHWRLGKGANLHSVLDTKFETYPHLLAKAGYFTGHWRKSWGPGSVNNWLSTKYGHPAGKKFGSFDAFLKQWPGDKPFCFWLGAFDPHRGYKAGTGAARGMDLAKINLFPHFPDSNVIRSDVADYYFEVERFDRDVNSAIVLLESMDLLDNTLVVVTGDHGMPFPRCKANLYDSGVRVPMAVRWPNRVQPNRRLTDFVSTTDLAPTFLEAAGVPVPSSMTGTSWLPIFESNKNRGRAVEFRNQVVFGKERHVPCQEKGDEGGTPMRAIRTDDFLLIRNYRPDRWPAGTPNFEKAHIPSCWLGDCDNGPTKTYMVEHRAKDEEHRQKWDLAFAKRPEFELYEIKKDPGQINNVAQESRYEKSRIALWEKLRQTLVSTGDPRETMSQQAADRIFDAAKYRGSGPRHPSFRKQAPGKKAKRNLND